MSRSTRTTGVRLDCLGNDHVSGRRFIGQFYYATVPQFTLIGDSATTYVLSAAVGNDSQSWIGSSPCVIQNKFSLTSCYFNSPPPNLYTADQSYVGLDLAFA